MLAFILLVFGILSRLLVTVPNFSPALALVLFGGVHLKKPYALLLPVALMMLSDLFLGLHHLVFFTWGSLILVSLIGRWLRHRKSPIHVIGASVGSAVVFFLITNFGVWIMGYYPRSVEGFLQCYAMAIPFFRSTLLSTVSYSAVVFGIYALAERYLLKTRFASAL